MIVLILFGSDICLFVFFFFVKQKTAYEISACLVGSEMCIRDRPIVFVDILCANTQTVLYFGENHGKIPHRTSIYRTCVVKEHDEQRI